MVRMTTPIDSTEMVDSRPDGFPTSQSSASWFEAKSKNQHPSLRTSIASVEEAFKSHPEGCTIRQLQEETGCSEHSVRVFIKRAVAHSLAAKAPAPPTGKPGRPATVYRPLRRMG